jgi:alkylation response protein AidB-like acyl-CoA dehydrogenase
MQSDVSFERRVRYQEMAIARLMCETHLLCDENAELAAQLEMARKPGPAAVKVGCLEATVPGRGDVVDLRERFLAVGFNRLIVFLQGKKLLTPDYVGQQLRILKTFATVSSGAVLRRRMERRNEASGRGSAVREVTMAKLLTQRANFDLQDDCFGILADLGHSEAMDLARAARDARLGPIGGGTDEIMKEILGKTLGL